MQLVLCQKKTSTTSSSVYAHNTGPLIKLQDYSVIQTNNAAAAAAAD